MEGYQEDYSSVQKEGKPHMMEVNFSGDTGSVCTRCEMREDAIKVVDGFKIIFEGCRPCFVFEIKNNHLRETPSPSLLRLEEFVKELGDSLT